MKTFETRKIERVLRETLGFRPAAGGGDGHARMVDGQGRCIRPVLRKGEMHIGTLYRLRQQLESLGVIEGRAFMALVKAA